MELKMRKIIVLLVSFLLAGCLGMPEGVSPVNNFNINRYLGKWYEVARLDHSFEKGLSKVTANYQLNPNGSVSVINRGYFAEENRWKEAKGTAKFVGDKDEGYLKVSFFGPFYGSYIIFELEQNNYQYAFVSGPDRSYLWLLSRTPIVSQALKNRFVEKAKELGFKTDKLIFVKQ